MTTSAPQTFAGPPSRDPAWRRIALGQYQFPPHPGRHATITVDVDEGIKVDQQKASGKDKAKTKVNGVDVTKAKVTVEWTDAVWDAARAFLLGISPNGPSKGDPMDVVHPELNDRGVSKVLVTKMGKRERLGPTAHRISFDLEEWVDPGTASTGDGTKTPEKADNWPDADSGSGNGATPPAKGFSGPSAPSADYTGQRGKP